MIRDLIYPDDARKVIDSLHGGLRYDAAVGVLGNTCSEAPLKGDGPDFRTGIRYGGVEEDKAARRDAKGLLPRLALISMVSRFERHAQLLLLQRRVLEELGKSGKKMVSERMWNILRKVNKEVREGPVKVCSELVVEHPSPALMGRMKWLSGICKIRNCLAHRLGNVEMVDVKRPGTSIDDIQEGDKLRAVWLRIKASIDGKEILSFPHQVSGPSEVAVSFEEYEREWGIGEQIEITALECQAIAMSLSLLGNQLLADFEREMNNLLGIS
jgi:hypothetical protein